MRRYRGIVLPFGFFLNECPPWILRLLYHAVRDHLRPVDDPIRRHL